MSGLYSLARSALFKLDAERAHEVTLDLFKHFPTLSTAPFAAAAVDDTVELLGLRFRNRVGLAAGLDKNGACLRAWDRLGFGFVEIGTITPRPQPGNPRPRMFRLTEQRALINRLGFNNLGVDALLRNVAAAGFSGVLGINIGKNADTPIENAVDDYRLCLQKVYSAAHYVTVNISSPNTRNLRDLQDESRLRALLTELVTAAAALAQQHGKRVPLLVKIAPDVSEEQLDGIVAAAHESGIDGLIATNTTIERAAVQGSPHAGEAGGLSGAPLLMKSTDTLRRLRAKLDKDFVLVGVGGVMSAADAKLKREAGADLVQIYSGLIFEGPRLIADAARALRNLS
ncbi:MAG: quinone-dependent dihydroorotate dehydrogenase [Hydrocarboniphaga sp.]|uniref:quinone-dependent dihydroorotate dehydrogenase n=1 Tax=Hydrocarboniphaga sp. TaxID=2033016 RepID=UPI002615B8C1|nr:quinone-dependent dihydroorotate dehydrogenase [Hydrocarboniphaga sp.]MDB5969488.1 quinone-dependent dihydroorotate dehydrogenase [Hydrocarboniphaga sp.]